MNGYIHLHVFIKKSKQLAGSDPLNRLIARYFYLISYISAQDQINNVILKLLMFHTSSITNKYGFPLFKSRFSVATVQMFIVVKGKMTSPFNSLALAQEPLCDSFQLEASRENSRDFWFRTMFSTLVSGIVSCIHNCVLSTVNLFVCLFVCLYVLLGNVSLIWIRHHYR